MVIDVPQSPEISADSTLITRQVHVLLLRENREYTHLKHIANWKGCLMCLILNIFNYNWVIFIYLLYSMYIVTKISRSFQLIAYYHIGYLVEGDIFSISILKICAEVHLNLFDSYLYNSMAEQPWKQWWNQSSALTHHLFPFQQRMMETSFKVHFLG